MMIDHDDRSFIMMMVDHDDDDDRSIIIMIEMSITVMTMIIDHGDRS